MSQIDQNVDRQANILSPINERNSEAHSTVYNTIDSNEQTVRRMNPADDRPINSSGNYNTQDANARTMQSLQDANEQTVRRQHPPTIQVEGERPIRSSGAYNYQGDDRPINASGAYNV